MARDFFLLALALVKQQLPGSNSVILQECGRSLARLSLVIGLLFDSLSGFLGLGLGLLLRLLE